MKITLSQLRSIIKEEVNRVAEALPKRRVMPKPTHDPAAEDFVTDFAMKKNSAADMWMDLDQKNEMYKLSLAGAKFQVITWDPQDDRAADRAEARQENWISKGFEVFASQDNIDTAEVIMVKK